MLLRLHMQIARSSALKELSRPLAWLERVGPAGTADDSMKSGSWSRLYELLYHQRQSAIQRLQQLSVQVDDKRLLRCMERGLQAVRPMAGTVNRGAALPLAHQVQAEPSRIAMPVPCPQALTCCRAKRLARIVVAVALL